MKTKDFLVLLFTICCSSLTAQTDYLLGIEYLKSSTENWGKNKCVIAAVTPHFPAQRAGIKPLDIILKINGSSTEGMDLSQLNTALFGQIGTSVTLTVKRIGQQDPQDMVLTRQAPLPANCFTEGRLRNNLLFYAKRYRNTSVGNLAANLDPKKTIRDPETRFDEYNSFDFEYTNQENPILEKKLASVLETYLTRKGLKRDKENPDLLVFINMFSGNEKQYIPPTQKISTRYQFGYDIWSGWGNRQYVESQQTAGYTQVTYFATLKVAMLDAKKAKQQVKTPPLVWQSEFNMTHNNEIDLMGIADNVYSSMVSHYPLTDFYSANTEKDWPSNSASLEVPNNYFYTGLCYDITQPNKVVYVFPQSPAENAGVRAGDVILSVNSRKMPTSTYEMENNYLYKVKLSQEAKKPASVLDNTSVMAGFSYIVGDYEDVQRNVPLRFELERGGNTQMLVVNPQVWSYSTPQNNIYKIKKTAYEDGTSGNLIAMGVGMEIPQNVNFFPVGIQPVNGYSFYFSVDGVTSRNWRMVNDYAFTWYNTGLVGGNKSNLLEAKWTIGPGVKIFPNFYITASVGIGGYFFIVNNNDALNQSILKVYFMPGVHWTIARSIYLFGRYNMSSGTSQSIDFGLKVRL